MNTNTLRRLYFSVRFAHRASRTAWLMFCFAIAFGAQGAALTWDADTGTSGAQDGSGTWTSGAGGWWDGSANVNWNNATPDMATFGAGTDGSYAITVGGAITCGTPLTFANSGYTLSAASAQTITIGGTVTVASGKTATIGNNVHLLRSGGGWTLSGPGTLNITGTGSVSNNAATAATIGSGATVNVLNGGSLYCATSVQVSGISGGATLNVNGGSVKVNAGALIVNSSGAGSSATVTLTNGGSISTAATTTGLRFGGTGGWAVFNLDGGTLTTAAVYENNAAVLSTNNFNGGTLKAVSLTSSNATFMTGLDCANVRNGGAFIDPNGQSITISQPLLHSVISGDNATDGGLTVVGAGGAVILTGNNTYTGNTTVNGGTLALSGSGSIANTPTIAIATGAALDVSGLTAGTYALNGSGALVQNLNKTGVTLTQGQVVLGAKDLTYGGTLTVTATGGALVAGNSFTLNTTTGTRSGWFSSVTLPTLGSGLAWDTNKLATAGVLDVYNFTTTALTASTLTNTTATILASKLANHTSSAKAGAAYPTGWTATASGNTLGSVSFDSGNLVYMANGTAGTDNFTVTFYDGHGSQTMAVSVTVSEANVGPALSPDNRHLTNGDKGSFTASGIPGTTYIVQLSTDMTTWTDYDATTASLSNGLIDYVDSVTITDHGNTVFYRLKQQ